MLAAGVLLGVSPLLLKLASVDMYISIYGVAGALISLAGFYLTQKAIYSGRVSIAISVIAALSIVTTFVLSIFLFNETITYLKWFGALAIIVGIADLMKEDNK
jgi:multidrug transporter EmrE-like cation transporter